MSSAERQRSSRQAPRGAAVGWRGIAAWAGLIVVGALALYAPSVGHPFVIDDFAYIAENQAVTSGAPLRDYFLERATTAGDAHLATQSYRPLRTLAFRAVVRTFGLRPVAFGWANRALYALSIIGVLLVALRVTRDAAASLVATALWALAPVHVEPVLYASSLGDHLSLLLELGALASGAFVIGGGALARPGHPLARPAGVHTAALLGAAALSLVLAALAMLAKEMAVTACALLAAWALRDGPRALVRLRTGLLLMAHGALAIACVGAGVAVRGTPLGHAPIDAASLGHGVRQAPVLLLEYARLYVVPLGHHPGYVLPEPSVAVSLAALAVVVALALATWRARLPGLALGLAGYAIALLPVLQLVPILADLADRFALVPSVGLALATAALITAAPDRLRGLALVPCAFALLLFAAGTLVEQRAWSSEEALWAHSVELAPESAQAHANLGVVRLASGQAREALAELDRARALGRRAAPLEFRRAVALHDLGRFEEAARAVEEALALDPLHGAAHALKGDLSRRRGQLVEAATELDRARTLSPLHPSITLLAANLAEANGRPQDSARELSELVGRSPEVPRFQYLLGRAALLAGDAGLALRAADACLALDHAQPQCRCIRGRALTVTGRVDEARVALDQALAALDDGPERAACEEARRRLP
ncbi:MAG: tetratricopeptide repeat protein [Myxococcales bacterium]|nr:tetratricopeptide repeat protein [Myxococcales bacterium]